MTANATGWALSSVKKVLAEARQFPGGQIRWNPAPPTRRPKLTTSELQHLGAVVRDSLASGRASEF
jgi:hypothetical protein